MGRRRSYETSAVVETARDVFWEQGYEPTSIGDLEQRTGLNRSSLYQAFGSKRSLFEAALLCYVEGEFDRRLNGMRRPGAGRGAIVDFFTGLADSFRDDPAGAARGCLMVNTIAELGQRDPDLRRAAVAHRDRLRDSFAMALSADGLPSESVHARARLLAATTMGIFLAARIDPGDAAALCDAAAAELSRRPHGPLA